MAERLWVLGAVAVFSGWHWSQMERPRISALELALLALLAVAPALLAALGRLRAAIAALVVAAGAAIWLGFGYLPFEGGHPVYPVRIEHAVHDGARSWFDTVTPFDPDRFPLTDGLVQLCFFGLMALFAWLLLDGRHALASVAAAFALFAIPSTAVTLDNDALRAALFLLLALAILAVCQRRVPVGGTALGQLAGLTAATLVAGLVLGSAPGVAKGAFFDWRHWNPLAGQGKRVSVGYVWNQDYGPLHFPKKPTTVFEVQSPRPLYWKAAILTTFQDNHWIESPSQAVPTFADTDAIGVPNTYLPPKAVEPAPKSVVQATFKIEGLADDHLLSTGQAIRYDTNEHIGARLNTDGTVITSSDLADGDTYTVRAYAPNPRPRDLAVAGNVFPDDVARTVTVNDTLVPIWGGKQPSKPVEVPIDRQLTEASDQAWAASGANRAPSEYAAVLALESYFRSKTFTYDQTPQYSGGPVLAEFMMHSHHGYCQMFAGSMALVLRLHGIPSRVVAGFTQGVPTSIGHYKIEDRDAHDWVEVYFPSYGWIPFEPTPSRDLPLLASSSDQQFLTTAVSDVRQGGLKRSDIPQALAKEFSQVSGTQGNSDGHHGARGSSAAGQNVKPVQPHHRSFLVWLLTAAAILVGALALAKLAAVRWRYLRRGPRGQASAAYHELSTYLGDQGIEVPANATFEELAGLADRTWGVDARGLAAAGSAARYAPPAMARRAGSDVRPEMRRVRRELRRNLTARERGTGALRLRSVLAQTTHLE